jgi:hypothetical protein
VSGLEEKKADGPKVLRVLADVSRIFGAIIVVIIHAYRHC